MRKYGGKVVSYGMRRRGHVARGVALIAGVAGVAQAEPAAMATAVAEVSGVDVVGEKRPLDHETGLSVLPTTVQDTPQAISIIPSAQLKAQGVNTLEQALRNVPGITVAIGEGGVLNGDQFKIRGFDAKDDVYVDGLRDFGVYTRDSFNYEEVQVLKGPSGAMFGRGTTGGVINTVSKRPMLKDETSIDLYAGNGDYYRGLADINHQLGETSAVRLSLMASSTGVVDRDYIKSKRWGAAVTGGWGLGTDTSVIASYLHQQDRRRPDYGVLLVQRPGEIVARPASEYGVGVERSTFLGLVDDLDRSKADILTVRVTHKASPSLTFTTDTRLGVYSRYFQYSNTDQCNAACATALFDNNPATEPFGGMGGGSPYDQESWGLQNISTLRWDADLGGLRSQLIVGIDLSYQSNDKAFTAYTLPPGITTRPNVPRALVNPNAAMPAGYQVFNPIPGVNLFCAGSGNCTSNVLGGSVFTNVAGTAVLSTEAESTSVAAFFTERLWLADNLSVIGSLRLDRYRAEIDTLLVTNAASPPGGLEVKSTLKSPRVSLVYEPSGNDTFYASWGRSETPQGTSIVNAGTAVALTARDLEPEKSEILEVGAKLGFLGSRLSFTASAFQIKKDNALQTDPGTGFVVAQSGERQEVKGLELGLTGRPTPAWTVSAGYAYLDTKIKEAFANCAVPTATTGTPTNIVCPVGTAGAIPVLNTVAVGRPVVFVPKHSFSIYSTYEFEEVVPGLMIGGDVTYQSSLPLTYQARSVSFADRGTLTPLRLGKAPESLTFNAFANYSFDRYRVGLNVYNIGNRLNYSQVFGNRGVPAPGRTVIVSVGATF